MDLLAQGAAQFEKMTDRFVLETTTKTLEKKREHLGDEWFSPENAEDQHKLVNSYTEILRTALPDHTRDVQAKLDKLYADQRSLTISKKLGTIKSLTSRLKSSKFRLAINAIEARTKLITELHDLIKFRSDDQDTLVFDQAKDQIAKLKDEIANLEPARRTTHITFHNSGLPKSSAIRFDGKLNETYETWHESGKARWRIPFDVGRPVGQAKHWRDNGLLSFVATFENVCASITVFSRSAEPLAYFENRDNIYSIELLPKELKDIKFRHTRGKVLNKATVAFQLLKSPKALKLIWKARKPGREKELLQELNALGDELESRIAELVKILNVRNSLP